KALRLPGDKGMVIRRVKQGSAAEKIGIRTGDALLAIDSRELRDEDDFASAVAALRLKASSVVLVQRGPYAYYISLELP
ncbi:MAG: PDZ domain-containing protein, partial [Deltaproteobacteria bacterium]|nr:PDZ domain-containing protein [Deltaproteobacteria bacterium]